MSSLCAERLKQAEAALADAGFLYSSGRSSQSVINRSYYAMFYSVLALLESIHEAPKKHSTAISLFDSRFVNNGVFERQLSKELHQAFELRQVSDYRVTEPISYELSGEMLASATRFVEEVRRHATESGLL